MRRCSLLLLGLLLLACSEQPTGPELRPSFATTVPGFQQARYDQDQNGYPDVGVKVTGKYTSVYAYDATGHWYWDLGDGRVYGTVTSIDALNSATLTRCDYQVQYRGMFQNNSYQDNGWIINAINCKGFDDNASYLYLIVHKTDPRYRGNPDWAVWGEWEYHVLSVGRWGGNLARPEQAVGAQ